MEDGRWIIKYEDEKWKKLWKNVFFLKFEKLNKNFVWSICKAPVQACIFMERLLFYVFFFLFFSIHYILINNIVVYKRWKIIKNIQNTLLETKNVARVVNKTITLIFDPNFFQIWNLLCWLLDQSQLLNQSHSDNQFHSVDQSWLVDLSRSVNKSWKCWICIINNLWISNK